MQLIEENKFFKTIGFFQEVQLLLNTDAESFKECFKEHVSDDVNFFGRAAHLNEFHGKIKRSVFELSKSSKAKRKNPFAIVNGEFEEYKHQLKLSVKSFFPIGMFLLVYSCLSVLSISVVAASGSLSAGSTGALIVILLVLGFYHWWVWINVRKKVSELLHEVEREFGFWMATSNALQTRL
jgi:hypothetical protein